MEDLHTEKNGGYDPEDIIWHQHSNRLMIQMLSFLRKETPVIDLGCGHNWYMGVLRTLGYQGIGIDLIDINKSEYFVKCDITQPLPNPQQIYNVISLEVGEHIPFDKCQGYLNNICRFGGDIILSWAVPGQPGIGHINCQTNEWVCTELLKRGYMINAEKTLQLRSSVKDCHCSWFQNTLMYFTPCE